MDFLPYLESVPKEVAIMIFPSGHSYQTIPKGEKWTLEELQGVVGGWIEIVPTKIPRLIMIVNEEGKVDKLEKNPLATTVGLYEKEIVGTVIIIDHNQLKT